MQVAPMLTNDSQGWFRADNHGWFFGWTNGTLFQARKQCRSSFQPLHGLLHCCGVRGGGGTCGGQGQVRVGVRVGVKERVKDEAGLGLVWSKEHIIPS
jgi:hypothetical protein